MLEVGQEVRTSTTFKMLATAYVSCSLLQPVQLLAYTRGKQELGLAELLTLSLVENLAAKPESFPQKGAHELKLHLLLLLHWTQQLREGGGNCCVGHHHSQCPGSSLVLYRKPMVFRVIVFSIYSYFYYKIFN